MARGNCTCNAGSFGGEEERVVVFGHTLEMDVEVVWREQWVSWDSWGLRPSLMVGCWNNACHAGLPQLIEMRPIRWTREENTEA